jgi:hypothetical protein
MPAVTDRKAPCGGQARAERRQPGYRAALITTNTLMKSYAPPLATNPHDPLYRADKAINAAQQRLDAAIDAKRHHTSQNLAHEVIKEARQGLKKAEQLRLLKLKELAQKAAEDAAAR